MKAEEFIGQLKFDERGLIVAIAQDATTGTVLMQAYMNAESIQATLETGFATYFSRSRQRLWVKGETSGSTQRIKEIYIDCDGDSLLLKVEQTGVACHTGNYSCFFTPVLGDDTVSRRGASVFQEEFDVILQRKSSPKEGSYTNYLFDKGIDKICKKVGEESAEVIIAAKNRSHEEVRYEVADLFYHVMVLLAEQGMTPDEVFAEMERRRKGD